MRSKRTRGYMKRLAALPKDIQQLANDLFEVFERNPADPILETKSLHDTSSGRHRCGSFSTRINLRYRAIYVVDNGRDGDQEPQYCWYWVGSREDYANFVGAR